MVTPREQELELQRVMHEILDKEREINNKLYAIKLTERIVFGLVGLLLVAVLTAIMAQVLK